jgi:SNF2 family DNA or RNA helicase
MVNRFKSGLRNETIFLLSKKAEGCGLNLIGAHRLVLRRLG